MKVEGNVGSTIKVNENEGVNELGVSLIGHICVENSTVSELLADQYFEGLWQDTLEYGIVVIGIKVDVASAIDGLEVQWSSDGVTKIQDDVFSLAAGAGKVFTFGPANRYVRVKYTNGGDDQGLFDLQTILRRTYFKPSSHRIQDSIVEEDDAELNKSVLSGEDVLTEAFDNVSTYRKALNVNSAYVHRKIVNETYHQETGDSTTPNGAVSAGSTQITVDSATGFATGSQITMREGTNVEIGVITLTDVTGSVFTLDRPLGYDYTTDAEIKEVTTNMAVGTGTLASPEIFEIDPPTGTVWQITRVFMSLTHATAADDGKFGGIGALTNGVCLRATTAAGRTVVFANWKTNADMKLDMYDVTYSDKGPAGLNGTHGRWTFTQAEVVAELDGDAVPIQKLEVLVQDDLTAGTAISSFTMRAQGRVYSP
ncbi:MAG: hypothetical protein KAJ19_27535 [Gammaproteobacteria bacterium]|nr:hypothetical protein [Gammaproteobacteria bacterium]